MTAPNKRDELLSLALRVEQATGADRGLDRAIANICDWGSAAAYTTSLDAAMTLADDNVRHIEWCERCVEACVFGNDADMHTATAATPALALTAAALRALAHKEQTT